VQFGQEGVMHIINSLPDASADEIVTAIMRAVRLHGGSAPQADDITIVLARRSR
jgi:serine phosphatase RsbU (regulator of sigma subunit)